MKKKQTTTYIIQPFNSVEAVAVSYMQRKAERVTDGV